jgi:RimJ/RimL family protein N-acetyltransferase
VYPIRTGRLVLAPFAASDLAMLRAFKADPRTWATMLGGVRTPQQTATELAGELAFWASHDVGMWTVRDLEGVFLGVTGLHERPDARGIALRMAFDPACRGHGLAREAAGAVLQDAHGRGGLTRIVAVARETNISSRIVLGAIGMRGVDSFGQDGHRMLLFESVRPLRQVT